jgi:hypothetical protein
MKPDLPRLIDKIEIKGQSLDIGQYLSKPFEDIREASLELPAVIASLGEERGNCVERFINAERAWRKAEAVAYFALKGGQFVARGYGEKMTEEAVKRALELDTGVEKAAAMYAHRKKRLDQITETISALKLKLDLVRSSETTRRWTEDPAVPMKRQ